MTFTKHLPILICCILLISAYAWRPANSPDPKQVGIDWVDANLPGFIQSITDLQKSLTALDSADGITLINARKELAFCRLQYKKVSYLLEYFYPYEASICNGPPAPDPEEDEVPVPYGLQVIESLLYDGNPFCHSKEFELQTNIMREAMRKLSPYIARLKTTDVAFLESLNLELIRIFTLYLAGFDAPHLESGIAEASEAYRAVQVACLPFCKKGEEQQQTQKIFNHGRELLTDTAFDSFDRLHFLKEVALPLQDILFKLVQRSSGSGSFHTAINSTAGNLFAPSAIPEDAFPQSLSGNRQILLALGQKLFHENALSKNLQRSCASCHNPELYFTDGLAHNRTPNGSDSLIRNTPTLLYAGMQYMQFWDGRVSSIEEQVKTVLKSDREMGSSEAIIIERLRKEPTYTDAFSKGWPDDPEISLSHVASALSMYVRSLRPFSSPFDEYLRGNSSALTSSQQSGFNLFMGKAGCGKCHFPPVFNGLLPPAYLATEFEVTGTTVNEDFNHPVLDPDPGRFTTIPVAAYKHAFKTPTVRNAAATAPYMHNGAFSSLDTLMEFYNRGGGAGLGLDVPAQTLMAVPLILTGKEKKDIISFIESLTDKPVKN